MQCFQGQHWGCLCLSTASWCGWLLLKLCATVLADLTQAEHGLHSCCVYLLQTGVLGGLQLWDERQGASPVSRSSNSWGHTGCGMLDKQMGAQRQVRISTHGPLTVAP